MSVTGSLTQISPRLLAIVEKMPSVLDIFWQVSPIHDEEPKLENLHSLLPERIELLQEISPDSTQALKNWTLEDLDVLASYKAHHPGDYIQVLSALPQIIEAGKNKRCLDVGKEWHIVSFLFRGDSSPEFLPLLAIEEEDSCKVNPILCGKEIQGYRDLRYLQSREVQIIAQALERFPQYLIRERFQQNLNRRPHIYPYNLWVKQHYEGLLEICHDLKKFYHDAASRKNSMLVRIV